MAAFDYTALNAKGKTVKGVTEADAPRVVRQKLREQGLTPLTITASASTDKQSSEKNRGFSLAKVGSGLSTADLTLMTRQLATLVKSGMPIERALYSISQQTEKQKVKALMVAIRSKVLEGHSLAQAFGEFPHVFPEIYRSTIASGEASGQLDGVLMRLADYAEQRHEMSKALIGNMLYPIIVVVISFGLLAFLLAFIVPQIVSIFESNEQDLPGLTIAVIAISDFLREQWPILLIIAIAAVAFGIWFMQSDSRRFLYHQLLLRLPMVGPMGKAKNASAFARSLGILVGSSVPVLEAMRISSAVIENLPMREAVENSALQVKEGIGISKALDATGYFPGMMVHLIGSGEDSGTLDDMLISASDYQDMELQSKISILFTILQPVIILLVGGLVMTIIMAVLGPIFELGTLVEV